MTDQNEPDLSAFGLPTSFGAGTTIRQSIAPSFQSSNISDFHQNSRGRGRGQGRGFGASNARDRGRGGGRGRGREGHTGLHQRPTENTGDQQVSKRPKTNNGEGYFKPSMIEDPWKHLY